MEKSKSQQPNDKRVYIEIERYPEFGTCCSELDETTYFVPFIPDERESAKIMQSYVSIDNGYRKKEAFYIYIQKEDLEMMKIEIRLKNIEHIEIQTVENGFERGENDKLEKVFYFNLIYPPKVFKKVSEKVKVGKNYVSKYEDFLKNFNFVNHHHSAYERIRKNGTISKYIENILVEHKKKEKGDIKINEIKNNKNKWEHLSKNTENSPEDSENEVSFDVDQENEFSCYIRADSYLSTQVEYINFYMLNLIMKIKIKFLSVEEYDSFITQLKFKNISSTNKTIHSYTNHNAIDSYIRRKVKKFYTYFLNFHFNLQYAILCLISQKRLNIFSFDVELLERMKSFNCEQQDNAAFLIELIMKEQSKLNSQSNLTQMFDNYYNKSFSLEVQNAWEKEKQNINNMKTRTIEITPSLIYYKPPVYEKMNHILRKYLEYKDNFVKVNFVDEECNKVFYSSQTMWILIHFLKNVMLGGVTIGSRSFDFLSASNSQMKNSSFWFFCLEGTRFLEVEQIIKELGDFTKETNIHKNAARRGQCLSTTSFIKILDPKNIKRIYDIERNGYIFTDGVGMISLDLAIECAKAFKLDYASAFQIRIGGIKGIIAVNPDIKDKELICVRPSMIKFDSNDTELGVIRCSNFSQGYLNRQIIILLSTLGVHDEIFLKMLRNDLAKYEALIESPNTLLGAKKKEISNGDFGRKCYFFMPCLSYFTYNKEVDIKHEPFFSSIVLTMAISKIIDLKNKGKIIDKYSAVLLGVIDETGCLEEGEVYVQIKRENFSGSFNGSECFTLDSKIIITKNPCLHPGDIKVLKACKKYDHYLSHMVNVVVFSSKGNRPTQNEISGGDLDGDSFYVSWNESLITNIKKPNVKPLDEMKGMGQSRKIKDIKMKDIVNSYIDYMKNDTIALISNAHSAFADLDTEYKAFNEKCLKLAELFCIAIDAPKHGNFVRQEEFKKYDLVLKKYPDFLENPTFGTYESPGILGQLYRLINVDNYLNQFEFNEYKFNYLEDYLIQYNLLTENCHKYVVKAYDVYYRYANEIKNLMISCKILSEAEFFLCENIHDKKRSKQFKQNDLFAELNNLRENYKNIIISSFRKGDSEEISLDVASAFYVVTYLNNKSVAKYYDFFIPKFKELIYMMVKEKRLDPKIFESRSQLNSNVNFEFEDTNAVNKNKKMYENYNDYKASMDKKKEFKSYHDIINQKRIFSLPWLIKEIREKLFKCRGPGVC